MEVNGNLKQYEFVAAPVDIRLWVVIHNYFAGLFGRRDLLMEFCQRSGINYPPKNNKKYSLPSSYLIVHDELKYLAKIRDREILAKYDDYMNNQLGIVGLKESISSNIVIQEGIIEEDKKRLEKMQNNAKEIKDSLGKINAQHQVDVQRTKINNDKIELEQLRQDLSDVDLLLSTNLKNWQKQAEFIENAFSTREGRFARNISKKIRKTLKFTEFENQSIPYGDNVKQIINGEWN